MSAVGVTVTAEVTRLLRATGDGQVWTGVDGQVYLDTPNSGTGWCLLVTRTVHELRDAGWVSPPPVAVAARTVRLWTLTQAGVDALRGAP